ncbi:LOW QUALITY PROTEIN: bifunctional glutamate/proline--tRNA ligase-like [Argopecten irradians]|uniref:LOW QUALITY PROTEIN: bifunctional glutamate/proline--tRNA ligase-like n=1 Tax=Argopecten irradians TaxID=31199 RepID=UPI003712EA22
MIDMQSDNGCMRESNLLQVVEGVTHALRTTEYGTTVTVSISGSLMREGLRKPHIYEYSRLNLQNTVLSKRRLTWFVDQGIVDGWDDPRFPTVRGVLRRGLTVEGLKQFIVAQGSSRSIVMMEWDKIWSVNKKVIDPIVPRYTALLKSDVVPVNAKGASVGCKKVAVHPKDYKKTQKITWLASTDQAPFTPAICVQYDHIITKPILAKDEDFKGYANRDSKKEQVMYGDPCLASLKKGDIIQLQRRGYYICDQPYQPTSPYTGKCSPCVLLNIPDGHQKEMPTAGSKHKQEASAKEKAQSKKGKSAEKSPKMSKPQLFQEGPRPLIWTIRFLPRNQIDSEVKILLDLKAQYKSATGKDWKPGAKPSPAPAAAAPQTTGGGADLYDKVAAQGNRVRELKGQKAKKDQIDAEVKILLALKAEYKSATGKDWKPDARPTTAAAPAAAAPQTTGGDADLYDKVAAQGNRVRELKGQKAKKDQIDAEVKILLALKAEYKSATGKDWKPDARPAPAAAPVPTPAAAAPQTTGGDADLYDKVAAQGNRVRELKGQKAKKDQIDAEVKILLALKGEYKSKTGKDWKPDARPAQATPATTGDSDLNNKIAAQGDKVRELKSKKADKLAQ